MSFRFNAKTCFLTFAQCSLSKEEVLERLTQAHPIQDYIVARERHQDGNYHIHCYLRFSKKIDSRNPRVFDVLDHHPNIKALTKVDAYRNAQKYAKKDGDFLTNIEETLGKRTLLFKELQDEGDLTPAFIRRNPDIMQFNFSNLRMFLNVLKPRTKVPETLLKKRHIWLYGPSNTGKSTWLRAYRMLAESMECPDNDDWNLMPRDVEMVYKDEYRGSLTVQKLNRLADGDCMVNTKGGSAWLPQVTFIIVSNYSIRDCYPGVTDQILETLYNRFIEVNSLNTLPKLPTYRL